MSKLNKNDCRRTETETKQNKTKHIWEHIVIKAFKCKNTLDG